MLALASFVLAWTGREPLLREAADLWIVSDSVNHADAIVVLGGDFQMRPWLAADFYGRGVANKILISQVADAPHIGGRASLSHTELNRAALLELGIPPEAVEIFGNANKNTREEAVALKEWANRNPAISKFIIPTEIFSARRVRYIFRRAFYGSSVSIEVSSFEPPNYTRADWWRSEQGLIAFQNEVLKYIYYRLKY